MSDLRQSISILRDQKALDSGAYYGIACALSLLSGLAAEAASGLTASEGRTAADDAMATLRQAAAAGWRDVAAMDANPDLGPIRSRPDYKMLRLDMAVPADPFARGH